METTIGFNSSATLTPTEEDGEDDEADHQGIVLSCSHDHDDMGEGYEVRSIGTKLKGLNCCFSLPLIHNGTMTRKRMLILDIMMMLTMMMRNHYRIKLECNSNLGRWSRLQYFRLGKLCQMVKANTDSNPILRILPLISGTVRFSPML